MPIGRTADSPSGLCDADDAVMLFEYEEDPAA
jgi:hypothetical protein